MHEKIRYFLCGFLMGIADTIPGVSGGTIAFITGIYGKLLATIKSADKEFFQYIFTLKLKKAFNKIPWGFALPLLLGIGLAIGTLAHFMVILLEKHADIVWAFFFGLIFSSLLILLKEVKNSNPHKIISSLFFIIGAFFSIYISFANPIQLSHTYPIIFFSGFIAICAMILPGISGAFILVLIGQYHYILEAVTTFNLPVISLFLLGCLCGILSFAHILSACLNHFYHISLAFLSGILAGSLVMLFPYKEEQTITQQAILTGLIMLGILIPLLLHYVGNKMYTQKIEEK